MTRVEERLRIESDGSITAYSGKVDFGQGLHAAYPRIVAEEIGVSPSRVRVVLGDTDCVPWDMGTFGSLSVEVDGHELRRAAAFARLALIARASETLKTSPADLQIADGSVRSVSDGRALTFAQLVAEGPITGGVPDEVPLAPATRALEDASPDARATDIVTGRAEFVGDVRIDGMLEGAVLHPAQHGALLTSTDRDAAMRMPGVVAVVHDGNFVGVVAERHGEAIAARAALKPVWRPAETERGEFTNVSLRRDAGVDTAIANSVRRVSARYFAPHVAAAPIGPSVGVADVGAHDAVVYGSMQAPFRLRDQVAHIAGLPAERVHVKPRAMSGGYGRHNASDAAIEAARLSKAVGRPVRVQWERDDELHAAPNRAEMTADMEAALDDDGKIIAWRTAIVTNPYTYEANAPSASPVSNGPREQGGQSGDWASPTNRLAMMAGRNAVPSYDIGSAEILLQVTPAMIRTGALRSLGAAPNIFAIESFIDEIANVAARDPIAFRLAHTSDPRLRRVLETVRDRSQGADRGARRGLGVACAIYRNTYVAEVVQVAVALNGEVMLERVWCAVDAGHIVHPDGARNQVEGAIQMAASWTLIEALPHRDGEVTASTWADYPIATFRDAPAAIDVVFTGDETTRSAGLGEPAAVPVAPAIANAVFAACGLRVRALPIRAESVRTLAGG